MGNAASIGRGRRRARTERQEIVPPDGIVPPSGYPGSQPSGPRGVDSGGAEGRIEIPIQGHTPRNAPAPNQDGTGSFGTEVSLLPPAVAPEHQKAITIRNDVNLRKTTLRLEKDEENPGFYLIAFSFDTTVAGSISIFFHAKEGPECCLTSLSPHLYKPFRINFDKGLGQKFRQAPGTGIRLSLFEEADLLQEGPGEIYPLIVRTETLPINPPSDALPSQDDQIGAPLPYWVHSQTTHAVLELKDGEYSVRVVKQTIWVDGVRYELQEIFGIENSDGGCGLAGCDSGKECVICLSEPRDTTVLPCRHMCMCSGCAKVLRFQTNRCPICRTPVERLLEIKVPKNDEAVHGNDNAELTS